MTAFPNLMPQERRTPSDARPNAYRAHVGHRFRAAQRAVDKWRTTYPPLPRARPEAKSELWVDLR
jgi:hypothetical protein